MTYDGMERRWDERRNNGMGGWRFEPKEEPKQVRDADDFLTALKDKLS